MGFCLLFCFCGSVCCVCPWIEFPEVIWVSLHLSSVTLHSAITSDTSQSDSTYDSTSVVLSVFYVCSWVTWVSLHLQHYHPYQQHKKQHSPASRRHTSGCRLAPIWSEDAWSTAFPFSFVPSSPLLSCRRQEGAAHARDGSHTCLAVPSVVSIVGAFLALYNAWWGLLDVSVRGKSARDGREWHFAAWSSVGEREKSVSIRFGG